MKVEMSMEEYDRLREGRRAADDRITELETLLSMARAKNMTDETERLNEMLQAAIRIVQFAVANLDPATVRGWPHDALSFFAGGLENLPFVNRHLRELATELNAFARTAKGYEDWRRANPTPVTPATAADYGPQTEETRRLHAIRSHVTASVDIDPNTDPDDPKTAA